MIDKIKRNYPHLVKTLGEEWIKTLISPIVGLKKAEFDKALKILLGNPNKHHLLACFTAEILLSTQFDLLIKLEKCLELLQQNSISIKRIKDRLRAKDQINFWGCVYEVDVIAFLLSTQNSIKTNVLVNNTKKNVDIVVNNVHCDIKGLVRSEIESKIQDINTMLDEIRLANNIPDNYFFDLNISGQIKNKHLSSPDSEMLEKTLSNIRSDMEKANYSINKTWHWKDSSGKDIITFKLIYDLCSIISSGSLSPNMIIKLKERILSNPGQFSNTHPNMRIIVKRSAERLGMETRFYEVLGGYYEDIIQFDQKRNISIVTGNKFNPGLWYTSDPNEKTIADKISGIIYYEFSEYKIGPEKLLYFPNPNPKYCINGTIFQKPTTIKVRNYK